MFGKHESTNKDFTQNGRTTEAWYLLLNFRTGYTHKSTMCRLFAATFHPIRLDTRSPASLRAEKALVNIAQFARNTCTKGGLMFNRYQETKFKGVLSVQRIRLQGSVSGKFLGEQHNAKTVFSFLLCLPPSRRLFLLFNSSLSI